MSRDTATAAGRAFAAPGFVDSCVITRVVGESTDLLTGQVTKTLSTVYTGACRVQQAAAPWAGPATVGQAAIRISALELQLPVVGSEGILVDDRVTITAAVHDTELVGKTWVIVGEHHATHKTTRRLPLEEILS